MFGRTDPVGKLEIHLMPMHYIVKTCILSLSFFSICQMLVIKVGQGIVFFSTHVPSFRMLEHLLARFSN